MVRMGLFTVRDEIIHKTSKNGTEMWYKAKHPGPNYRIFHNPNGPALIFPDGSYEWRIDGELHRLDGPAVHRIDQDQWWVNGSRHRLDGPAIEDRIKPQHSTWWICGNNIKTYQHYQLITKCSNTEIIMLRLKHGEIIQVP